MKQILSYLAVIALHLSASAQSIPNGNFEDWTLTSYFDPLHWHSSNVETIQQNSWVTVSPVTGYNGSGYAIRMTTDGQDGRIMPGYFSNTGGDPLEGEGGEEYHEIPSMLSGYARYHTLGVDTALLVVVFKKQGQIIRLRTIPFYGEQNTFIPFHVTLQLPELPDSVIIAAVSSDVRHPEVMTTGSFLELDELTFEGRYVMPQLANHDFEHWMHGHIHHAHEWGSFGLMSGRTEDTPFGDYAAMMTSYQDWNLQVHPSGIYMGYMNESQEWYGGVAYTELTDTVRGWYKYLSDGSDAGCLSLEMLSNQVNIGGAYYQFYPVEDWTFFEIPIQLYQHPDTMRIQLMSSVFPFDQAVIGSTLFIDNLELSSQPLLLNNFDKPSEGKVFPNPASEFIYVLLSSGDEVDFIMRIYSEKGDLVRVNNFHQSGELVRIPLDGLDAGTYVYEITGSRSMKSGVFVVGQ
jgi:hypothetical protein